MPFKYVDPDKAPTPPAKKGSSTAAYFADIIENLPGGKVAVIEPEEGQTSRGIKVSVGRVASSRGIKIQSYSEEGSDTVYVRRLEG